MSKIITIGYGNGTTKHLIVTSGYGEEVDFFPPIGDVVCWIRREAVQTTFQRVQEETVFRGELTETVFQRGEEEEVFRRSAELQFFRRSEEMLFFRDVKPCNT